MLDDALVELEATCSKTVARARVTAVEDGHVILLGHPVDGGEEAEEVLFGVYIFFAMG